MKKNEILKHIEENKSNIKHLIAYIKRKENQEIIKNLTNFLPEDYTMSCRLWHIMNKIYEPMLCICGKLRIFEKFDKGYFSTCGNRECKKIKREAARKKTCLSKYGVNHHWQLESIKEQIKKTNMEKYGIEHNLQANSPFREKNKEIMKAKYGAEHPLQSKELLEKRRKTCIERHGTLSFITSQKAKDTIYKKYGVDNVSRLDEIRNKIRNTSIKTSINKQIKRIQEYNIEILDYNYLDKSYVKFLCNVCKTETVINRCGFNTYLRSKQTPCRKCNPRKSKWYSNGEKDVLKYIKTIYKGEILENKYSILNRYEVDVYLPKLDLVFEYNGLYWHSELYKESDYHLKKQQVALKNGIKLIHIWEDDWLYEKKEIVKSIINKYVNYKSINKIYARKCDIKQISNKQSKSFLIENHLLGYFPAKYTCGLYYENQLVTLMSFAKNRKNIVGNDESWELLRYCTKINYQIIGGASKLFKYFLKNNDNIKRIITYSDKSYFPLLNINKSIYNKLGFCFIKDIKPGYFYIIDGIRSHRSNWTKSKLVKMGYDPNKTEVEIMNEQKYYRIWNSGNYKFEYIIDN